MTSDDFFIKLENNEILDNIKFDVIFIDGLHLAEQAVIKLIEIGNKL